MTAHKHAETIKAKADNMDLVVFVRMVYSGDWVEASEKECLPSFHPDNEYFLCLPQHKEACLHWLNGGEIEFNSELSDGWNEYEPIKVWGIGSIFMQDDYQIRIKPRKEKRWIAYDSLSGNVYGEYKSYEDALDAWSELQLIEIEIEV